MDCVGPDCFFMALMAGAAFIMEVPLYLAFGWVFFRIRFRFFRSKGMPIKEKFFMREWGK